MEKAQQIRECYKMGRQYRHALGSLMIVEIKYRSQMRKLHHLVDKS